MDPRIQKLAKLLVNYSTQTKEGDKVIISGGTEATEFISAIYKEVILAGAHPILRISLPGISPFFYKYAKKHQLERFPEEFDYIVKKANKYIGIISESNTKELTNADPKKVAQREKVTHSISDYIVNSKPKMMRVTTSFPTNALAQDASMSLTEYENFHYSACLQDWKNLKKQMQKYCSKFKKNSSVHLIGENVDLKFRVHGDKAKVDGGEENMPGGEFFMAPIRTSANGWIKFEYPAMRGGKEVTDIKLTFKDGKVIESTANKNQDFLREMLAIDENASYIGELGIGCNPKITKYTGELLFDEKIGGTIHLSLFISYKKK